MSRRYPAYALLPSADQAVVPAGNCQTDIVAFFLHLPLPNMEVDNITVQLIQDELASVRWRFRTEFLAVDETVRQSDNA